MAVGVAGTRRTVLGAGVTLTGAFSRLAMGRR